MGNDESHFNVSLIVLWGTKSQDSVHKPQPFFWRERRVEAESSLGPYSYQPNALPLGQTGSHIHKEGTEEVYVL